MLKRPRPLMLLILDGWGYSEQTQYNAIAQAHTPQWDKWWRENTHSLISCSGKAVGLPAGQMGNSEVGHMHIGAGRIIAQDLTRINQAIADSEFEHNRVFDAAIKQAKQQTSTIHIMGLLSPGGVHSHEQHIFALVKLLAKNGITNCKFHLFLDGRDTPPKSAEPSINKLTALLLQYPCGEIASITGRYYAMDRDQRWDRVQLVYDMLTEGRAQRYAEDAQQALNLAYQQHETDEFVKPTIIGKPHPIQNNDTVIFMNFRADRSRQLCKALIDPDFTAFTRQAFPKINLITLTQYRADFAATSAFPPINLQPTLGECLAAAGLTQLRIAETEKYAHVTFFLNGGIETTSPGETRILIPSLKIATYDLQPAMSAPEITTKLVEEIALEKYDVIICNFANADMVGHSGNFPATVAAIECLDQCFSQLDTAIKQVGGEILVTADHGNAEAMYDAHNQQALTAHTSNPVPFIYIGRPSIAVGNGGKLSDIAPTILYLLDLPIPQEMTGNPLVKLAD